MQLNPLDFPGRAFEIELRNPNPSSKRLKDGPIYRLSFEVSKEVHDAFMTAAESNLRLIGRMAVLPDTDEQAAHEAVNGTQDMDKQPKTQPRSKAAKEKTPYGDLWRYLHIDGFFAAPGVRESLEEVRENGQEEWSPHLFMRKVFGVESLSREIGPGEIYNKFPPNEYPAVKTMVEQAMRKANKHG